jgi:hypothetical protein
VDNRCNKLAIIGQLYERNDSDSMKLFVELAGSLIDENREKIDTARVEDVPKIQGKIIQLKELQDIFLKHPATMKKK